MNRYMESDPGRKKSGPVVTGSRVRSIPPEEEEEYGDPEEPEREREAPDRRGATRLLTIIQITACAAVLIAAIALRVSGGALYQSVRSWYFTALGNSIVPDSQVENMKRTVLDLWSAISSSRGESSSSASSQGQSGGNNNGTVSENQQSGNNNNADNAASQNQQSGNNAASRGAQSTAPNSGGTEENGASQAQPNAQSAASAAQNNANAPSGASAP